MLQHSGTYKYAATARLTGCRPGEMHVCLGIGICVLHHVDAVRAKACLDEITQLESAQIALIVPLLALQGQNKADITMSIECIEGNCAQGINIQRENKRERGREK